MIPRLGFLGLGWIGLHRMRAIAASGAAEIAVVADVSPDAAAGAAGETGAAVATPEALLDGGFGLDGIVIATPSALHAEQAIAALSAGMAVFCQKPVGRTAGECQAVVDAARRVDLLLGVDLSYRHLTAVDRMREVLASGDLGRIYAADLVFHNAYGPDKAWFSDPAQSGGGCVMDLGIHLVDLALWMLNGPKVESVSSRLFAHGRPLTAAPDVVEDHALATLDFADAGVATLACSWFLHAGRDAVIGATFHGTEGAVELANVGGSFYDFRALRHRATSTEVLAEPPDDWGGRAAVAWARRLSTDAGFDEACEDIVEVTRVLDRIYGR